MKTFLITLLLFNIQTSSLDEKINYHTKKADIYYHDGDFSNMLYHLKEKVKLDKKDVGTYADIAYYYWSLSVDSVTRKKEFQEKCLNALMEGLKYNKEKAYMWDEIGYYFAFIFKDVVGSIPFYEEAIKRPDCKMTSYHFLSVGYYKQGKIDKAINILENCVKRFPQDEKAKSKLKELKSKLNSG